MGLNLHCSVCDKVLESKESWNNHLVEESHQEVAREETSNRWWRDEQLRNSCLVLFSSVPLSNQLCEEIISQFSKKVFATDFVWWRERPKLAILQFESRSIAKEVVKHHGNTSVGGHRVQLKEAWTYLELEFEELLGIPEAAYIPSADVSIPEVEVIPFEAPIPEVVDLDVTLSPGRDTVQTSPRAGPSSGGSSQSAIVTVTRIINDYEWIKNVMTYSKRSFDKLEVFIGSLKKLSKKEGQEAFLLRNHYLGIRSSSLPEMIHVCFAIPGMNGSIFKKLTSRLDDQFSQEEFGVGALFGAVLKSNSFPTLLNILTSGKFHKEVGVCRLILYLCCLDSRLRGVITLVEFWAKYHELKVANGDDNWSEKSWQCQDPLGLHLLVVVSWGFIIK